MKCQILFPGKNKKNIINLSSAGFVREAVMIKRFFSSLFSANYFTIFSLNILDTLIPFILLLLKFKQVHLTTLAASIQKVQNL